MWSPLRPSPPFEQAAGAWSCPGQGWLTFQILPGQGLIGSNAPERRIWTAGATSPTWGLPVQVEHHGQMILERREKLKETGVPVGRNSLDDPGGDTLAQVVAN